ncbi:hypothetical protein B5G34_00355 [Flavonifractor sp. An82]|nr:hypothetical protein B5G34_00355 [Flavonifractor sp. An82]
MIMMKAITDLMHTRLDGALSAEQIQIVHTTRRQFVNIRDFLEVRSAMKNITFELPDDVICVSITSLSGNASELDFTTRNYGEEKLIEGVVVPWERDKMNEF